MADSQLIPLSPEYAAKLEAEGKVRVMRAQADVDRHYAAWRTHHETVKEMYARARAMTKDADEIAKEAGRFSRKPPVIDWDAPVKTSAKAEAA